MNNFHDNVNVSIKHISIDINSINDEYLHNLVMASLCVCGNAIVNDKVFSNSNDVYDFIVNGIIEEQSTIYRVIESYFDCVYIYIININVDELED